MKLPTALSIFHLSDSQWPAPMSYIEQCQRVSKSIWNAQTWHILWQHHQNKQINTGISLDYKLHSLKWKMNAVNEVFK